MSTTTQPKVKKLLKRARETADRLEVLLVSVEENARRVDDGGDDNYNAEWLCEANAVEAQRVLAGLQRDLKKLKKSLCIGEEAEQPAEAAEAK